MKLPKPSPGNISKLAGAMSGIPCFVIGNSPCLLDIDIQSLEPFFTIGINRAYRAIKTTMLIWQDPEIMRDCRSDLEKFDGLCVCPPKADPGKRFMHFNLSGAAFHKASDPKMLYGRGSTGPLAVQMASIMGCSPILLVGMDCRRRENMTDFYGVNRDWKTHTPKLCESGLRWIESTFTKKEVENLSSNPAGVAEATRRLSSFAQGRDRYLSMLRRRVLR